MRDRYDKSIVTRMLEKDYVMNYYIKLEGLEKAKRRVAEPGTSEHHTGLAIDIAILDNGAVNNDVNDITKNAATIFLIFMFLNSPFFPK